MMAEAVGKATGAPGICFVTAAPGATNAAGRTACGAPRFHPDDPVSSARSRATCASARRSRKLDYRAVFGTIAKWTTEIDDPARIPELISRAFYAATSGRPGRW